MSIGIRLSVVGVSISSAICQMPIDLWYHAEIYPDRVAQFPNRRLSRYKGIVSRIPCGRSILEPADEHFGPALPNSVQSRKTAPVAPGAPLRAISSTFRDAPPDGTDVRATASTRHRVAVDPVGRRDTAADA
jgi:hypothetical protein